MFERVRSATPETQSSWDERGWSESEKDCPQCGKLVWECGWWDDPPESGGGCIGTAFECGDCGWNDRE